jgi:hypothetical protein
MPIPLFFSDRHFYYRFMSASQFSFQERRIVRWIIFFVILSRILLMFRSEERIYTRPYLEDSFYLFNCAEHFAHGEGFTCDGKQATNGVQPLIVILYSPLFLIAGANKLLALKLGFILIAIFDSFCVTLIARLVRVLQKTTDDNTSVWKSPPIIAAILWATLYPIFVHTGSGLETGLYSVMLLASIYSYAKISRMRSEGNIISRARWIVFGIMLGITVLARIDAVFLVVAISCYEFYKFKGKGFMSGAIIAVTAFIISSPWWWFNYNVFGSLMPQSGVSESLETGILAENLRRGAIVVGDILTVFFFLPNYELPAWFHFLWLLLVGGIVVLILKKFSLRKYLKENFSYSSLMPFYFFCAALIMYYVLFFSAPHFLPRYFHPLRIVWLILFACSAPKIAEMLNNFYARKKNLAIVCLSIFSLGAIGFSASRYAYYYFIDKTSGFYLMGKFALLHPTEKIGMEQSGTAGFMSPNVINLDGKVNFEALEAKKKGDIGEYIEKEKLYYIADWREFSEPMIASASTHGGKFQEVDSIGKIIIFKRVKK